jgi:hypothetical protein
MKQVSDWWWSIVEDIIPFVLIWRAFKWKQSNNLCWAHCMVPWSFALLGERAHLNGKGTKERRTGNTDLLSTLLQEIYSSTSECFRPRGSVCLLHLFLFLVFSLFINVVAEELTSFMQCPTNQSLPDCCCSIWSFKSCHSTTCCWSWPWGITNQLYFHLLFLRFRL